MNRVMLFSVLVLMCVGVARAEMVLVDDFEDYDVDTTIHMQGYDSVWDGPRWYSQANTSQLVDSNRAFVVSEDNTKCVKATSQGRIDDDRNYMALAMSMYDVGIYGEGTVYFRFKHLGGANGIVVATNDKWAGWDYYGDDTGDISSLYFQGNCSSQCWTETGAIAFFCGGPNGEGFFYGRDGSTSNPPAAGAEGYKTAPADQQANVWNEFWIQVDHANDRTKYYACVAGGTPTVIANPDGGEWWAMRNQNHDNNAVLNLRFQVGYDWPDGEICTMYLDDVAVDDSAMTLDRPDVTHENPLPGDLDGDGDVDLDDFVILKNAFGLTADGDCDGDGDTDLDDFVILKNNFGATS